MTMKKKAVEYTLKAEKRDFSITKISSSKDAETFVRNFYYDDINIYESAFIIMMNRANNAIGYAKISQGGICGTLVDIRIVCKYAIESLATSIIFVHNHPSGNLTPSFEDRKLVKKLCDALGVLDIKLHDSIIISDSGYLSMTDEGLM